MSGNDHHEEGGFWPAYVDAITNVMLNILFVVAVFAMALNTAMQEAPAEKPDQAKKSLESSQGRADTTDKAQRELMALEKGAQMQEPQPKPLTVKESNAQTAKPNKVRWAVTREEPNGESLLRFDFEPGSSQIETSDTHAVRETLRKVSSSGLALQWHIWVSLNTRNTSDVRQGYLRAMAVRSALIDAGQTPKNIEVRLLDAGQDPQDVGKQTVWLSRSVQSTAPDPS